MTERAAPATTRAPMGQATRLDAIAGRFDPWLLALACAIACVGSGAGTIPSDRANFTAPAKHSVCGIATASMRPSS